MTAAPRQEPRPLFVISNDYGELGFAMIILRGQSFARRAAIALPERLHAHNPDVLPGATHHYASTAELLDLVDRHGSNVVLLCSGYLLSGNGILTHDTLTQLMDGLRARRCVILTTDPFMGLAPRVTSEDLKLDHTLGPAERRAFVGMMWRVASTLRPAIHLYRCVPREWLKKQCARSLGFHNPAPPPARVAGERRWLFVIGAEDAALQECSAPPAMPDEADAPAGAGGFAATLTRLVEQALDAGARPVLVAPPPLVDALSPSLAARCILVPFCPYAEFAELVTAAEYAFYWNVFSASILARLELGLPVFFFDPGHMARRLHRLYDLGVSLHYGGKAPTILDPNAPLDPAQLARQWQSEGLADHGILHAWGAAAPTPDQLLDQLVNP